MRRLLPIVVMLWVTAAAPATAAGTSLTLDARHVPAGERYVLQGDGWAVYEGCGKEVTVSRRIEQHLVGIGTARVADDGSFTFMHKIPRTALAGSRIVLDVTQLCTSVMDAVSFTKTVVVRVMPPARTCAGTIAVKGRAYVLETWGGLGCGSAQAIGPFLDAHISPDGFDCTRTDPRVGYNAACTVQVHPRQRVTARRIKEV
jgi:hypothetical protein